MAARLWAASHRGPVWAAAEMAAMASDVSKPGNWATSKLPSACCWPSSQSTAGGTGS